VLALGAEAAADVGRDDAHRVLRDLELLGDELADVVRHLRRGVKQQLVALGAAAG
jgi:hypothetical protein